MVRRPVALQRGGSPLFRSFEASSFGELNSPKFLSPSDDLADARVVETDLRANRA